MIHLKVSMLGAGLSTGFGDWFTGFGDSTGFGVWSSGFGVWSTGCGDWSTSVRAFFSGGLFSLFSGSARLPTNCNRGAFAGLSACGFCDLSRGLGVASARRSKLIEVNEQQAEQSERLLNRQRWRFGAPWAVQSMVPK